MAQEGPRKRPGWRNQGADKASPPPPPPGKHGWRTPGAEGRPQPPKPGSKWKRLLAATVALGAVVGLVVYIYWVMIPPPPVAILFAGADYENNLLQAPNLVGWKGMEGVHRWTKGKGANDEQRPAPLNADADGPHVIQHADAWKTLLDKVRKVKSGTKLLLYLSLHGGVDAAGAFLLADDDHGRERIYVRDIFNDLTKRFPVGKDFTDIILVLDAPHVDAQWPLGLIHNDFVAQLRKDYAAAGAPANLFVLCAAGEGQISWASEEWQTTTFAHYFVEGLAGAADDPKDQNGRITLSELEKYLATEVDAWAKRNRNRRQTPALLGDTSRFGSIELSIYDRSPSADRPIEARTKLRPWENYSKALEEKWSKLPALRAAAPWIFAPHAWREYEETLLRWEHVERVCVQHEAIDAKITHWKGRADKLEGTFKDMRRLANVEGCFANNLVVAAALGHGKLANPADEKQLLDLRDHWLRGADEIKKLEDQSKGESDPVKLKKLVEERKAAEDKRKQEIADRVEDVKKSWKIDDRAALTRLAPRLLDDLAARGTALSPAALADVVKFWNALEDPFRANNPGYRPIELHYLLMLNRDAVEWSAKPLPAGHFQLALETRRRAERTLLSAAASDKYTYSEHVYPWIKADLQIADELRREGEDYLLTSDPKDWEKAKSNLEAAQTKFDEIGKKAEVLRAALQTRDDAWALLPHLARWTAQRPEDKEPALQPRLEAVAKKIQALTQRLQAGKLNPDEFAKLNQTIRDELLKGENSLLDIHLKTAKLLAANDKGQHEFYHEVEALLNVPLIDRETRADLIRRSREFTKKQLSKENIAAEGVGASPDFVARQEKNARLAFGLPALKPADEKKPDGWILDLPEKSINAELHKALEANEFAAVAGALARAVDSCRLLPGGLAKFVETTPYSPPDFLRRGRVHELLVDMAKRTYEDHWDDMDAPAPYYATAARAYLEAGSKLLASKKAGKGLFASLDSMRSAYQKDFLENPIRLFVGYDDKSQNLDWTTERQLKFAWRVAADVKLPRGVPALSTSVGPAPVGFGKHGRGPLEKFKNKDAQGHDETQMISAGQWPPSDNASVLGAKKDETLEARCEVIYRGQRATKAAMLTKHEPNLIVSDFPPPPEARIAVRTDDSFRYKEVAIVMDNSGSMNFKVPTTQQKGQKDPDLGEKGKDRRYDHALRALRSFLSELDAETRFSVFQFANDDGVRTHKPEVRNIIARQNVVRELDREPPVGATPLAKTIARSLEMGFFDKNAGPRLVLALTDGVDTRSAIETEAQRKRADTYDKEVRHALYKEVNKKLRDDLEAAIAKYGTQVHVVVVCFIDDGDEDSEFPEKQFDGIRNLRLVRVKKLDEKLTESLYTELFAAIKPELNLIHEGRTYQKFRTNPPEKQLKWHKVDVPNKTYNVEIGETYRRDFNPVRLELKNGDNTFLVLKRLEDGRIGLERGIVGLQPEFQEKIKDQSVAAKPWQATLIGQKYHPQSETLTQRVMLENLKTYAEDAGGGTPLLRQEMPGLVWLEVAPKDKKWWFDNAPSDKRWKGQVHWFNDWDAPAPALMLKGQTWLREDKRTAVAELKMWPWRDRNFPSQIDWTKLVAYSDLSGKHGVGLSRDIQIEPPESYDHEILWRNPNGEMIKVKKECVLIRVRHELHRPVMIKRVRSNDVIGEEHVYFHDPEKKLARYTAKFYLQTGAIQPHDFQIVCLESFKNATTPVTLSRSKSPPELYEYEFHKDISSIFDPLH